MREQKKSTVRKSRFSQLLDNNYFVLVLSLVIAVVLWCAVSMFRTTEITKTFQNIKVQLNLEGSLPDNNNLQIFGEQDFTVDVTVTGKSYLINADSFANSIDATVSFASVNSAGTYSLPISVSCSVSDVEITNVSKNSISVYFDEMVEKEFSITEDIVELGGYSLPEGFTAENPRLSVESVTLEGPSLEMNRISSVQARVELDKELTGTETFTAEIVYVASGAGAKIEYVAVKDDEPVYVTIPVSITSSFNPAVTFTNIPKDYRKDGIEYTASPETVNVTVSASDKALINAKEITVGSIDFSEIDNTINNFRFSTEDMPYTFADDIKNITVVVDMRSMAKRWLQVSVSAEDVNLPANATLRTETVPSVQVIGPGDSVNDIENSEAYAIPVLDGIQLQPGINTVPAKIVLRTLTDSWVRGTYTVEIQVEE